MKNLEERFVSEADTEVGIGNTPIPVRNKSKMFNYKDLLPNALNRELNWNKVYSIAESIETHGRVIDPLQVTLQEDGKGLLWSGHHRHAAITYLVEQKHLQQFEYVKCEIMNDNPVNNELLMIDTNLERAELSPYDAMMAIGRKEELILEKRRRGEQISGTTRDIISQQTSKYKPTQIGTYLRIYKNGSEQIKNPLKDEKITLTTAARLCLDPCQEQNRILKDILNSNKKIKKAPRAEDYAVLLEKCMKTCDTLKKVSIEKPDLLGSDLQESMELFYEAVCRELENVK